MECLKHLCATGVSKLAPVDFLSPQNLGKHRQGWHLGGSEERVGAEKFCGRELTRGPLGAVLSKERASSKAKVLFHICPGASGVC